MAGRQGSYSSRQYGYSRQTGSGSRTVSSHSRYSGRGGQAYVEGSAARVYRCRTASKRAGAQKT